MCPHPFLARATTPLPGGVRCHHHKRRAEKQRVDSHRARGPHGKAARFAANDQASFVLSFTPVLPISRASQALASLQSRRTVSGETFSTSAVSSTLSPPKKRSSITLLFRGSTSASALSA